MENSDKLALMKESHDKRNSGLTRGPAKLRTPEAHKDEIARLDQEAQSKALTKLGDRLRYVKRHMTSMSPKTGRPYSETRIREVLIEHLGPQAAKLKRRVSFA
jgi:hypothetical protein